MLPRLRQPAAGSLDVSEVLSLTPGAMPGLRCQRQRYPPHQQQRYPPLLWCHRSLVSGSTSKPRVKAGSWGQAAGHLPCRLPDSGFWCPPPLQGQCSDLEGRLQDLFIFPGCLLWWEWSRGEKEREKAASWRGWGQGGYFCLCTACTPVSKLI